ncbi:hypothetical protein QBC39DRAFT_363310 [Podospora conica]|nr:hypothetical protein QBC39DRAFT_363310 [Schizothecium conicum]
MDDCGFSSSDMNFGTTPACDNRRYTELGIPGAPILSLVLVLEFPLNMSVQTYRNLMRAARIAFQGDAPVLAGAQETIRKSFRDNASLPPSHPDVQAGLKHAEEVAQFLRTNLVQGKKEGDVYKLNIHEHIERGDNDTVKLAGKTVKIDGKKCSDL